LKWIWSDLAAEHGLSKEITFEKLEATAEDTIILLRILWERAAELGIDMEERIAFHANVLLSAMGGFRPGCCGYEEKQITCWCSGATSSLIEYLLPQLYH
jgi:hypothetical protein